MKVIIPQIVDPVAYEFLGERGYEVVIGDGWDSERIAEEIADADGVLARIEPYPAELLAHGKKLKVIGRHGIGTDNVDLDYCRAKGIAVAITKNCNNISVAELALSLLLACSKQLTRFDAGTKEGVWPLREQVISTVLTGKTLGIIGLGAIGQDLARMAYHGLNLKIVGYDRSPEKKNLPDYITLFNDIESLLPHCDALSLHLPLTEETRYLINADSINMMRSGAILINTARGGVVEEAAVYEALQSGQLSAAGFDVFEEEPARADNPLFSLPNFIATPHIGGLSREARRAQSLGAAQAIDAVLSGGTPEYPVVLP